MITNWVSVSERLPNDRREVLTWGKRANFFHEFHVGYEPESRFTGVTRCNVNRTERLFDNERVSWWRGLLGMNVGWVQVTHWAEITSP